MDGIWLRFLSGPEIDSLGLTRTEIVDAVEEAVPDGYSVELTSTTHTAPDAEQAYADAVIHLLRA